jgi:hypothetical protein
MEQRIRRMNDAITPFTLAVPQADLEDLNRRIDQTRWPDAETVDDWTQGAPLAKVKALVDHWRHRYDWRRCEAMLNNTHIDMPYEVGQPPIRGFAINNIPGFWLKNGEVAKDLYVAFTAKNADAVRASYKAAIDARATSNKEPSFRPEWHSDYFAANIGDPDGYNIEIAYKPWLYK